jgi:hypothetical protein
VLTNLDWRHWLLSHAIWVVAVVVAIILGHSWIAEHDARIQADAQIKVSEATIKTLEEHQATTDAAAAQKVQTIVKVVHDAVTPPQVITALPQIDTQIAAALSARVAPDNPAAVEVNATALVQVVGDLKTSQIQLGACQSNLADEKAIVTQKDTEIVALKKKPRFWKRVGGVAKAVGIGIGIGVVIGGHL